MSKIKLLDDKTINKIAAGEVVERPVAVVKELVENSIDALATHITIEIKKGGIKYIRVTDNGIGMDKDDLKRAFIRHSTSKISKVEDLGNIITLGFRGEALASISAVSRMEIISKERKASTGKKIILYGGEIRDENTVGTKDGTTVIAKDLFFNLPVRRGFLKSESKETIAINDFIYRLAISNPGISFNYIKDGKTMIKTPGNGDLKSTIYSVLGAEFIKSTYYFDGKYKEMSIKGYTSNLKYFRGNRSNQHIFINGRIVKSQMISKTIEDIYKERIPIGKFPNFVLFLEIDPSKIDVNIHPTKMEIRFKEERDVSTGIKKVITDRLVKENLIPELKAKDILNSSVHDIYRKEESEKREQIPVFEFIEEKNKEDILEDKRFIDENVVYRRGVEESQKIFNNEYEKMDIIDEFVEDRIENVNETNDRVYSKTKDIDEIVKEDISKISRKIEFKGIIFDTYILCEDRIEKEFYMIDQHAAHERVLYEEFRDKYFKKDIYIQDILGVEPIELSLNDIMKVKENEEILKKLGFDYDYFGENSIIIRGIPLIFGKPDGDKLFFDILDDLDMENNEDKNIYETKLDKLMKKACTSAIKGGDRISEIEVQELINLLFNCKNPFTCPHGRPITLKMSINEIEKHFSRIQN